MAHFLAPVGNSQLINANGVPLNGGKIFTYLAGTTTLSATATSNTGAVPQANPIILNSLGLPANPIWMLGGAALKFVIKDAADVTLATLDNITGINDTAAAIIDEWIASGLAPTYISATVFSVLGDQTLILQVGRRVKTTNTVGMIFSVIVSAVFSAGVTTLTVANDAGVLAVGLSAVAYGLLSPSQPSLPKSVAARASMGVAPLDDPVFTTKATSPRFITATGVTTVGSGVAGTIFTAPAGTNAIYVVAANIGLTNDPVTYGALAFIMADGTSVRRMSGTDGANLTITISGLTVLATQISGTTQTINATITRLG